MMVLGQALRRTINPVAAAVVSAVLLIGTLSYMIAERVAILQNGTEIVLKTAPVDPRDLMRGDYVQLRYEDISLVDTSLFVGDWPEQDTFAPLWLTLETTEDGLATVKSLSLEKPKGGNSKAVYLKSKPVKLYQSGTKRVRTLRDALKFGIERYYVPEGEGLDIEAARNQGRTTVAIRVSADGKAQITRLMIDGKTLYQEPLY